MVIHHRGKAGDVASSALQAHGRIREGRENWDKKGKDKTTFLYVEMNSFPLSPSIITMYTHVLVDIVRMSQRDGKVMMID